MFKRKTEWPVIVMVITDDPFGPDGMATQTMAVRAYTHQRARDRVAKRIRRTLPTGWVAVLAGHTIHGIH